MIKKRTLIWIVVFWILITLVNYYYTNFFLSAFIWLGLGLILLIGALVQLVKLIKERKDLTKFRIIKLIVFGLLFILTFYRNIPNRYIEKADWTLLKSKRIETVEQIKNGTLKSKGTSENGICELPFKFPIISNGGNDVWIIRGNESNSLTVRFWVFRNFFDSPQTIFVYTNDQKTINRYERKISLEPENNWKLEPNWYRIHGMGY